MFSKNVLMLMILIGSLMAGCGNEYYASYQPVGLPIIISIDSFGDVSVSWEGGLQTPIGRFSIGTTQPISSVDEIYKEKSGVLVVNANGMASIYDLKGNENISIKLESGYYEQVVLRKEGSNWYFEAEKIYESAIAEVNLVNEHCEPVDFYIDGQKIADAIPAESSISFNVEAGNYETTACIAGTQSCGDSVSVTWKGVNSHSILRSSSCDEIVPSNEGSNDGEFSCGEPVTMTNLTPYTPTLKPRQKYTATLTFYNPNDCDVRNLKFVLGWNNDLSGPSGFSIPIIYANRFAEVSINLTAPAQEGDGYFTFYSLDSSFCNGPCAPYFIYANVKKQ